MQTFHNCRLNQAHRSIYIMVFNLRNQHLTSLLNQVVLYCSYVCDVFDVLIKLWVNCHLLCTDCKSFSMFLSASDVKNERNTIWVFSHHFFQKMNRQVNTFHNQWFISLLVDFNYFWQFFLHQCGLLLVAGKSNPTYWGLLPVWDIN